MPSEHSVSSKPMRWAFLTAWAIFTSAALTGVFIAHVDSVWMKLPIGFVGALVTGIIIGVRDATVRAAA